MSRSFKMYTFPSSFHCKNIKPVSNLASVRIFKPKLTVPWLNKHGENKHGENKHHI